MSVETEVLRTLSSKLFWETQANYSSWNEGKVLTRKQSQSQEPNSRLSGKPKKSFRRKSQRFKKRKSNSLVQGRISKKRALKSTSSKSTWIDWLVCSVANAPRDSIPTSSSWPFRPGTNPTKRNRSFPKRALRLLTKKRAFITSRGANASLVGEENYRSIWNGKSESWHRSPEELLCDCCQTTKRKISEDTSEKLIYAPTQYKVEKTIRPKYACPNCRQSVTAANPPFQVIDKGLADSSFFA